MSTLLFYDQEQLFPFSNSRLSNEAQLEALKQLICDRADIVIQNLRPGQVDKLGLDGPSLLRLKPSLIYCNLGP
jgi:crotonobetainyl-CoA:carnitine CoA-transferase CaiB-like acyl-CoA transferase